MRKTVFVLEDAGASTDRNAVGRGPTLLVEEQFELLELPLAYQVLVRGIRPPCTRRKREDTKCLLLRTCLALPLPVPLSNFPCKLPASAVVRRFLLVADVNTGRILRVPTSEVASPARARAGEGKKDERQPDSNATGFALFVPSVCSVERTAEATFSLSWFRLSCAVFPRYYFLYSPLAPLTWRAPGVRTNCLHFQQANASTLSMPKKEALGRTQSQPL